MKKQVYINKGSAYFKKGQIVEAKEIDGGFQSGTHFIPKQNCVVLNEKLSKSDEDKVRKIVREILKKMFWRMYTRSSFITR